MGSRKILLFGGGGHCRSVLDSLLSIDNYGDIGIIERDPGERSSVLGVPVIGTDEDISELFEEGWKCAAVTLGSVGNTTGRRKLYELLKKTGFSFPAIIDPSAIIGREVIISEGVFVGKRAVVNSGAKVREFAIINTGAIVEHDCVIGEFAHISPGSVLCGGVEVRNDAHVGAEAVIRQQLVIGRSAVVGAGSVVIYNIPDRVTVAGNPAKMINMG